MNDQQQPNHETPDAPPVHPVLMVRIADTHEVVDQNGMRAVVYLFHQVDQDGNTLGHKQANGSVVPVLIASLPIPLGTRLVAMPTNMARIK